MWENDFWEGTVRRQWRGLLHGLRPSPVWGVDATSAEEAVMYRCAAVVSLACDIGLLLIAAVAGSVLLGGLGSFVCRILWEGMR